jgi:hypothetical protein
MSSNATIARNTTKARNLIERACAVGLLCLAGAAIAVSVAAAPTLPAGGAQASNQSPDWRSFLEHRAAAAPRRQRLAGPVVAPVGEGWG